MIGVDYLVLADAVAAVGGKHYIHGGGWDTLFSATFLVTHSVMGVAIRLRVPADRAVTLVLDVHDADGRTLLPDPPVPIREPINIDRPPHLPVGNDQMMPLALSPNNLRFTGSGHYAVTCRLDGEEAARAPFRVALTSPQHGG